MVGPRGEHEIRLCAGEEPEVFGLSTQELEVGSTEYNDR